MLKALIVKQFDECFRSYFVNRKTGKANSKGKIILSFVFFGLLMLMLGGFSFGLGMGLCSALYDMLLDIQWTYFSIFGAASILMGVFGSVFNTYASVYLPKDNEFLLSMPIKPGTILLSRLTMVYLLSLLYSGMVWVPAVIATAVSGHFTALSLVMGLLLAFVIALFVTVITCALGWLVALIAGHVRNKSFLVMLLSVSFLVCYYAICFNMQELAKQLISNISLIAGGVQKYAGPLYSLGLAGMGDIPSVLIFTGITLALTVVLMLVMNRSYMPMLLKKPRAAKAAYRMTESRQTGVRKALFLRDMKRLTSSATYMMNAGFGVVLLPVLLVFLLFKLSDLQTVLTMGMVSWPPLVQFLPLAVPALFSFMLGMNMFSLPSVSLEGKNLWILQTMPLSGWQILRSKRDLHLVLNLVPALVFGVAVNLLLGVELPWIALGLLFIIAFIWFNADIGLFIGLRHADLKWSNETTVIKQNMWVLVVMVMNMLITAALCAGAWFLRNNVTPMGVLGIMTLVLALITLLLEKWLRSKGSRIFETL